MRNAREKSKIIVRFSYFDRAYHYSKLKIIFKYKLKWIKYVYFYRWRDLINYPVENTNQMKNFIKYSKKM